MNSYGEPQSARARASVPGASAGSALPDDRFDSTRPSPDAYRRPGAGHASVSGSASVGSASVGSARVPGPPAPPQPGYGTRGATARAAVRPVPPSVPGPAGPGRSGPPGDDRRGAKPTGDPAKRAKKRRRANILTAAAAVFVILAGVGVVAGTYFFDSVDFTEPAAESQTTQVMASDNKTVLAQIGDQNRSVVPYQQINPLIGDAVMAAEDKNFLTHAGIDFKGILRAAWNNFTGGSREGASTITQQYARHAADLKGISYNRKLREAVIAQKMEDVYSKQEILGRYLNSVYFGRGAYGIEAAVKAYFGPSYSSIAQPGKPGALNAGQAAILASVIKQPEPVQGGYQGYDPGRNLQGAKERWNYTLNNMVEMKWLAAADRPTTYPKFLPYNANACSTNCGLDKPTGNIIKYVKRELTAMGIPWNQGGLRIKTTINESVQKAAEEAVSRKNPDSLMHDLPSSYNTALVAIDPANGRVLGYYGGPDGTGYDYAGPNYDAKGVATGSGRPPGSSFKIYTLLAGLSAGYGFDTTWDSTAKRIGGDTIDNSSRSTLACPPKACPLDIATEQSYNFPFYWLADDLGPDNVIEAAHKAGIQSIGAPASNKRIDLNTTDPSELKKYNFGDEAGFGQYNIYPIDHANGMATIADGGVYNKAHFVEEVQIRDPKTGQFTAYPGKAEHLTDKQAFSRDVVAAIQNVIRKIPGIDHLELKNGRPSLAKTGTWEFDNGKTKENGDSWLVGATPQLATSVWVGNGGGTKAIKTPTGRNMQGATGAGVIWRQFMNAALKAMDAPVTGVLDNGSTSFVDPSKKGNGVAAPAPVQNPTTPGCVLAFLCQGGTGNNNGGKGNPSTQPTQPGPGGGGKNGGGGDNDPGGGGGRRQQDAPRTG
jgi:membrane peptidoglycan carboxypeptidase